MTNDILSTAYVEFFKALKLDGIEPLVETAFKLFNCPVLVTDENYGLIYQYPNQKIGQDIWDHLHQYGALPLETIQEYQAVFLQNDCPIYEPFYANWGLAKDFPRIFGEIYTSSNRILGHVAVFMMGRKQESYDLELTKIFIDALRIRMSSKNVNMTSNTTYLQDLLNPNISLHRKMLATRVLTERLKGSFCIMVTSAGNTAAQMAFANNAVNHLNHSFRNTVSAIQNDSIVTLFGEISNTNSFKNNERKFLTSVSTFLLQSYAFIGISKPFSSLADINNHFYQAYLTAQLKINGITFFEDEMPRQLFIPALQNAAVDTYIHPALAEMLAYDNEHNTNYFETMKIYNYSMHDKDLAASRLCVHRNTLLYRLNRIQEIFSLAYEDTELAVYLLNSFQLWDLAHRMV